MTAGESRVEAYAKSTVVSSIPVRPGKSYPLSVLDHAMDRHSLHLVFYYRPGPTLDRARLKDSLSDLLWYFPATSGRLTREAAPSSASCGKRWVVKCNDAGVRVVDARVDGATVDEWIESATAAEERQLVYWEPIPDDVSIWSPFYVQITEFKDKGYAIGVSCTHMHADPTCAILLVKAWSDCHRRACIANPPFFHPPALIPRPIPAPSYPLLSLKSTAKTSPPPPMSAASFRFPAASVRSLLACLVSTFPSAAPFDALAALFWLSVARAAATPTSALTVVTEFRKRMYAPLPHGFYGNAAHFSRVELPAGDVLRTGWSSAAEAVGRHVAGLQEDDYWSGIEWLAARGEGAGGLQMYGPELTCVKVDHVMGYAAEMEERAAPARVACWVGGAEGEGVVVVLPAMAEGEDELGRTVEVVLPVEVAEKVCADKEILRHGPTVSFTGRV